MAANQVGLVSSRLTQRAPDRLRRGYGTGESPAGVE
jgi:hypothetical protein